MKTLLSMIGIAGALMLVTSVASDAAKSVVPLTSEHITTQSRTTEELGAYYVAAIPVPKEVSGADELYGAYIELVLDVDALGVEAVTNDAPDFEVYALTAPFSSALDTETLVKGATGPINIARGENRRVVVDVTEIVRYFLKNPTKNYGVVLGSLTRDRDGVFEIKSGTDGTLARLIFHFKRGNP